MTEAEKASEKPESEESVESDDSGIGTDYPPETHHWMKWSTIHFIHRPTWRPLAWVFFGILVTLTAGLVGSMYVDIRIRVEGSGEISATPGVLKILGPDTGILEAPRVEPGEAVKKGQVLAWLRTEISENRLEAIRRALDRNVALLEKIDRTSGLSDDFMTGAELLVLNDPDIRKTATELQTIGAQLKKRINIQAPYESAREDTIEVSRILRSVLDGYIERHRVRAPAPGELLQFEVPTDGNVKVGEPVAILLPEGANLVGRILIPPSRMPNVEVGQSVRHRIAAYPFQRYGLFEGEVLSIEQAPPAADGSFQYEVRVSVRIPAGLSPRLAKTVRLVMGMKLESEITTGEAALTDLALDAFLGRD